MNRAPKASLVSLLPPALMMVLAACSSLTPQSVTAADPGTREGEKVSPTATVARAASTKTAIVQHPCLESIEQRELEDPYERPGGERYTLSPEELVGYLELMGIASLCIPKEFGAPFLNVDWNDLGEPKVAIGRMVSIGFENLYPGSSGWGSGYIVYSTYDFEVGSEYDVFATEDDLYRVRVQSIPNQINVGGTEGFTRIHKGMNFGAQPVNLTYIFPFISHYVAVVLNLGNYEMEEADEAIRQIELGAHEDLMQDNVRLMDLLVSSIQFSSPKSE